ncbi:MAG: hypothetical protein ACFFG0_09355 [Candidatus Thorarchaeota archaeon]
MKKRQWLTFDEKMMSMTPKEYYKEIFRELIQEINDNEKSIKKFITVNH